MSNQPVRICLTPRLQGVGGMVSFQARFAAALAERGIEVTYDPADQPCAAVLVIGGTRHLGNLISACRRGVRIVQRLDGMNWMHRQRRTGLRHFLRAEYGNWLLNLIRTRLAQHIVYQSSFSQTWWQQVYGPAPATTSVVYNGVDLAAYTADGPDVRPQDRWRVLMVEGSLMGGYEQGLESGIQLAVGLANTEAAASGRPVELMVAGRVSPEVKATTQARAAEIARERPVSIHWAGLVAREHIPELDRSAHLLFSSDVNAACPNSVIEALACGCPVVAYATGALPELVTGESGRLAAYGGDPWKLEPPDFAGLVQAAQPVLHQQEQFRLAARKRAVELFSLDTMVEGYLAALLG